MGKERKAKGAGREIGRTKERERRGQNGWGGERRLAFHHSLLSKNLKGVFMS